MVAVVVKVKAVVVVAVEVVVLVGDGVEVGGGAGGFVGRGQRGDHTPQTRSPTLRSTASAHARTDLAAASMFICVDTARTLVPVLLPRMRRLISPLPTSHSRMSLSLEDE